ncbi:MAG: hypothetical protein ASARMPREDX12_000746 [Alectoria sarmentosa]|nr:MAG: hypothetical protein ASARMPREDX12_000746 [Alectoria sarmentosa]
MSMPLSNLTAPNLTVVSHGPTTVFSPVLEDAHTFPAAAKALQDRHESPCIQTVEVPVWHLAIRLVLVLQSQSISGSTKLWVVISITIFLTMLIPVVVLWARWKLSAPRRSGKRISSVQLEKDEAKKASSTSSFSSSSTPKSGSNSKLSSTSGNGTQPQAPNGRRNALDRLLGRNQANVEQAAYGIRTVNNINVNGGRTDHQQQPTTQTPHPEELPPMSPQVALESLRSDHPLHLPPNRPWMHQDATGRWVPLEEGCLHPGLPPPPRVRNIGTNINFVDHGSYVPGGWQN